MFKLGFSGSFKGFWMFKKVYGLGLIKKGGFGP